MKSKSSDKMTQSKLAAILGVSRQLIAVHRKRHKAPPLEDIEGWIDYLAAHGRSGSAPPEERKLIAKARLRVINAQGDRLEMENEAKRGNMMPVADVTRFAQELVGNILFAELDRIAFEAPVSLKGKSEVEIHEEISRQIKVIKQRLGDSLDLLPKPKPAAAQ